MAYAEGRTYPAALPRRGHVVSERWTPERARAWHDAQPWLVGCNFLPSTAINQIEMWSAATFDPATLRRELGWARDLGFNSMRVFLHDLLWREDREAFEARIDAYLAIAHACGIRTLLVFFDDCWHEPHAGMQPAPRPGVHNSGWARSPGRAILLDRSRWEDLRAYVTAIVRRFGQDERVLAWDVYNEPTNLVLPLLSLEGAAREAAIAAHAKDREVQAPASMELLKRAFGWIRAAGPCQPLTAGIYSKDAVLEPLLVELSDLVSFHHYRDTASLERLISELASHGRPLWCTEYLNRRGACLFETQLPVFEREGIACWNWGLVDGKSQTKFAWMDPPGGREPEVWFHDVLRSDGTPYRPHEAALLRDMTGRGAAS